MNQKARESFRKRAEELVSRMTLEEKVSQMLHSAPAIPRLGIKEYNWWNESLHGVARAGVATVFPQAIGLAATFDEEHIRRVAETISHEARAKYNMQQSYGDRDIYKGLTMWSPNVNIFRDPRWGRGHETYGEDPYLSSRLGVAFVKGLQGDDETYMKTAACAKHFAVHSGPEADRHSFNAIVSKKDMYETYLPAFEACVREGDVEGVMGAYNRTNGEVCCGSEYLLRRVMREKYGFDGYITSDCSALPDFHLHHKVTAGPEESVTLAVTNTCDLNCGCTYTHVVSAVEKGMLDEKLVTDSCVRLFTTRMKLGEFDDPADVPFSTIPYTECDSDENRALNRETAKKTLVLLKNKNDLLPLDPKKLRSVGIIGPNADSRAALVGNYEGTASRYITVNEGIRDLLDGTGVRVYTGVGCHLYKQKVTAQGQPNDRLSEVKAVCEQSDVVIVCLGLDATLEGEQSDAYNAFGSKGDKPTLKLPGLQEDILRTAVESGKPTILVMLAGSAIDMSYASEHVDAILQAWYPGAEGGHAVADILFGNASPEGHLPITLYASDEDLPPFDCYAMEGRTYRYMKKDALYPFGYGLSYTDFEIGSVACDSSEIGAEDKILRVELKNVGTRASGVALQAYVKAEREGTPNAQLKALKKVYLEAGESQTIELTLPRRAFALWTDEGTFVVAAGDYTVHVGICQPDERSVALTGKRPTSLTFSAPETTVIDTMA